MKSDNNGILIIVPKYAQYKENSYYEFPLGLAYISSSLKQAGNSVDVLNLNHYNGNQYDIIKDKIVDNKITDNNTYKYFLTGGLSAHYNTIKNIVKDVRNLVKDSIIIVGGGIVSSTPELMYNYLKPDYVILGEGEFTIVELIENLKIGNDVANIKGIGYVNNTNNLIITQQRDLIDNLDIIPFPDTDGFEFEKYLDMQSPNDSLYHYIIDYPRVYPIISSRGCPYNCTFCYHPLGQKYRSRSVKNFISEIKYAKEKYNVTNFAIFDELISHNTDRLYEICKNLKQLSVKWMCQLRVDTINEDMLNTMKNSGCYIISYGFESANDIILKSMNKHISKKDIENAIVLTRKAGIGIQGYFIFGDVDETKETAEETLNFWKKYNNYHITMGYIRPYPGSDLWKRCMTNKSYDEQLKFLHKCVNSPPNLSKMNDDEWFELQKDVQKAIIENNNFGKLLCYSEKSITIKCLHCNSVITYNNFQQRILGVFKITCRNCNQSMNMTPLAFENVRNDYERNIKVFETIKNKKLPVVVTPCMNEAEFSAMIEVFFNGINDNVIKYMDIDDDKVGRIYLGKSILKRNKENCKICHDCYFLIPLTRFANRIFNHLVSLGIDKNNICRLDEVIYDNITIDDFAKIFDDSIYNIQKVHDVIKNSDFRYRILSKDEKEKVMIKVIDKLMSDLKISGSHRKDDWENGWKENLVDYIESNNINTLIPKFVKKNEVIRFQGNYILPLDSNFETNFVKILRYYLFSKYFNDIDVIYEFGCGTGLNLVALNELFPEKTLYGLDWSESSCNIVNELSKKLNIKNMKSVVFDMFHPININLSSKSGIFTIGAMEQLGTNFNEFLNFIINEKPLIVINIEVNYEILDKNNLFDYLAATYIEKRNYLRGFHKKLKELENEGIIEIIEDKEIFGGLYHNGYSSIIWKII